MKWWSLSDRLEHLEKRLMHNEEKIWQFPEFLVHFVLLFLLLFVVARFFEAMSTFLSVRIPTGLFLGLRQILPHLILFKNA